MIRSLVAQVDAEAKTETVRRNLDTVKLEQARADGELMWLDFTDPTAEELQWLAEQFALSPSVMEDIQRLDRRPGLLVYPNYLFLSLFEPNIQLNRVQGKEIHCLLLDKCFITVRNADATTVDSAYNRVVQNPDAWQGGVAYFLYLTAQNVVDAYYPLLDRLSNYLNGMEEKLLNGGLETSARKAVYRIKQQLIDLRQMVAPQREVFSSVIGERRLADSTETRDLFRHLYERLLRVYDVIDSQRDFSSNVLDIMENQEARNMVDAVNRLTIFSMIFLPLTFFTGLFDIGFVETVDNMTLPISGRLLFVVVIAAMIVSAGLMAAVFRRRGWI
jgi:magnesium transporter